MRIFILALFTLSLAACIIWAIKKPGYDSISAVFAALAALAATFITSFPNSKSQSQKVGKGGTAIQAGNDVNIGRDLKTKG